MPMILTLLAAAAISVGSQTAQPPATIVFFRPKSIMGAAVACPIRLNGRQVVELGRGKYARFSAKPGRYVFNNNTAGVEVNAQSGQSYFIRCSVKPGFASGRSDLQFSDETAFVKVNAKEAVPDVPAINP